MGLITNMSATLVEATPYRLRYLLTTTDDRSGAGLISNALGATPDLRTDALTAAQNGIEGLPLYNTVAVPVANQAEARRILLGESGATPAVIANVGGHCTAQLTPRSGLRVFTVDANEGAAAGDPASAGYAVYIVYTGGGSLGDTAYLDIKRARSKDDYVGYGV